MRSLLVRGAKGVARPADPSEEPLPPRPWPGRGGAGPDRGREEAMQHGEKDGARDRKFEAPALEVT
jgi:hypothetical protein